MIRSNELKLVTLLFIVAFLTTWIMPIGVIFAEEEEEIILKELTGEEEVTSEEVHLYKEALKNISTFEELIASVR